MKRIYIALFLLTTLYLVSLALADEASYYYGAEDWLIRAYTNGSNVYLEVRDTNNNLVDPNNIVGLTNNPQSIANNSTTDNVSLSFDPNTATAYIFYTTAGGLQLATIPDIRSGGGGGPQISVSPTSVNFGSVSVGSSSDSTVTVSNIGTANLILGTISVTGTYFSRQGGTCADGQTLAPQASCTIIVRFSPGVSGTFNGNLAIPSDGGNVNVPLSGTGVSQGGNIDLTIDYVTLTGCCENGVPFSITVSIKNNGTGSTGSFMVKSWISTDATISGGDKLLCEWPVNNLSGGGTTTVSCSNAVFTGFQIHTYPFIITKVDANNVINESNENNNINYNRVFIGRLY